MYTTLLNFYQQQMVMRSNHFRFGGLSLMSLSCSVSKEYMKETIIDKAEVRLVLLMNWLHSSAL